MPKPILGVVLLALNAGCTVIAPASLSPGNLPVPTIAAAAANDAVSMLADISSNGETPAANVRNTAATHPAAPVQRDNPTPSPYPTWIETAHGEVRSARAAEGCIALTFDDGPHASLTPRLLGILADENVHATFFLVGNRVQTWPEVVRAISAGGHEIGNHSWDHANLTQLGNDQVTVELVRTDAAIAAVIGARPDIIRFPYDASSPRVLSLVDRPVIFWDIDTLDWNGASVADIIRTAVSGATSGSIILMHDIHSRTVDAVAGVIDGLRARGFEFVTVSQLLTGQPCRAPTVVATTEAAGAPVPAVVAAASFVAPLP